MTNEACAMNVWSKFGRVMLVLVLSLSLGAHWALLQTAAWASMLVCYTQTDGFCTAVTKTFDGKHPCKLCVAVQQGKSSEKKSDQHKPVGKIDGFLPVNHFVLRGAAEYPAVVPPHRSFSEWFEPPPTPPPRWA